MKVLTVKSGRSKDKWAVVVTAKAEFDNARDAERLVTALFKPHANLALLPTPAEQQIEPREQRRKPKGEA